MHRCEVTFVFNVCERADDGEDKGVDESLDLGYGVHLENIGKFCYLGDMLNWGRSEFFICSEGALCI